MLRSRFLLASLGLSLLALPSTVSAQTVTVSDLTLIRNLSVPSVNDTGSLTVDRDGTVYVLGNQTEFTLHRLDTDDTVTELNSQAGNLRGYHTDLRIGPDRLLYAMETGVNPAPIKRFGLDGAPQPHLALVNDGGASGAGLNFDHHGNVYCADTSLFLSVVTPAGVVTEATLSGTAINDVDEIERGPDDAFFITGNDLVGSTVWKVDHNLQKTVYAQISGAGLSSMAYDFVTGDLYVSAENLDQVLRLRDTNGDGSINPATESEIVVTDLRARDVGYGPASNGNGFSLYLTHPQQIVEIGGLGTWDFDQGPRIDDDHDGYCENGSDQNADGDCLDPGEDTADHDCDDADPAFAPGVVELCDALDNDCDGDTDEDFSTLGGACQLGVGACENAGFIVCSPDQTTVECDAVVGTPTAEICGNVIDEDCDGVADECSGAGGTGGAGGTAGTAGSAGIGGVGGMPMFDGGGVEADGGIAKKKLSNDGCGCHLASRTNGHGAWLAVCGLFALARRHYRLRRTANAAACNDPLLHGGH